MQNAHPENDFAILQVYSVIDNNNGSVLNIFKASNKIIVKKKKN